jgi:hypothetical protein
MSVDKGFAGRSYAVLNGEKSWEILKWVRRVNSRSLKEILCSSPTYESDQARIFISILTWEPASESKMELKRSFLPSWARPSRSGWPQRSTWIERRGRVFALQVGAKDVQSHIRERYQGSGTKTTCAGGDEIRYRG